MRILPFFFVLALASCSNKQETPNSAPPPPVATTAGGRPVIVAFGDSLTAGLGVDAGSSYPDVLQEMLDARGLSYRVVNEGLSGDTTSGGLARLPAVLAHKPAVVILELGANDGLRGIPIDRTKANLSEMLAALKSGGARVLLVGITLPRNYGMDYIGKFDRMFPDLAKAHGVPLLPFLLQGVALNPKLMQADALHPNADGCRVAARNVTQALLPLLTAK
ncbi:MAG: arylesterase [Candidatus Solibacter usitatus]|nr:arylesterase [Candidatus Solibacter usitatus]